jgi:hypothetical protein
LPSTAVGGGENDATEGLMRSSSFLVQCSMHMEEAEHGQCRA